MFWDNITFLSPRCSEGTERSGIDLKVFNQGLARKKKEVWGRNDSKHLQKRKRHSLPDAQKIPPQKILAKENDIFW